jgi:hypothetical protein
VDEVMQGTTVEERLFRAALAMQDFWALAPAISGPKGHVRVGRLRGHQWPLFHGDANERVIGNELWKSGSLEPHSSRKGISPLGPAAG